MSDNIEAPSRLRGKWAGLILFISIVIAFSYAAKSHDESRKVLDFAPIWLLALIVGSASWFAFDLVQIRYAKPFALLPIALVFVSAVRIWVQI